LHEINDKTKNIDSLGNKRKKKINVKK